MANSPATRHSLLLRLHDLADGQAWGEFVEIYSPLIKGQARRMGLQEADAADLAQDVFKSIARSIERWNPDPSRGSFRSWLFRVARNHTINFLAAQARRPRGSGDPEVNELLLEQPSRDCEDSRAFDLQYKDEVLKWALKRVRAEVKDATWQSFWMTAVEGRTPAETARTLGMSVGTVYQYKSRVVVRLRRQIEQVEGSEP